MLSELQQRLTAINGVDPGYDIRDFLVTDRTVAAALSAGSLLPNSNETVLLAEEEDGLSLSVYLDKETLSRLISDDPLTRVRADRLEDLWAVLEGISHFNYLVSSAQLERPVTLLELELQAEVDKYVTTVALLLAQGDTQLLSKLHSWLFESVTFRPELDAEQVARYRTANDYASRFCHQLRDAFIAGSETAASELRMFSRMSQQGKISHIHSRAWSGA